MRIKTAISHIQIMKKIFLISRKPLFLIFLSLFAIGLRAQVSQTFNFTGAAQYFTVPTCVTSITIEAYGAQGANDAATGWIINQGGYARGCFTTTPSNVYTLYVGGQPTGTLGGYNGGGTGYPSLSGNTSGAGGGGASDVRFGGTALTNRILVAGGGGGGGSDAGSSGNWAIGGGGGGLTGNEGQCYDGGCAGTQPGSQTAGGLGMCAGFLGVSQAGSFGYGGNANPVCLYGFGCGSSSGTWEGGYGGGGGWYGGGAGASNFGGGGGSGYILPAATFTAFVNAVKNGHGQIIVSYDLNMPLSVTTPSCSSTGDATVTASGGYIPPLTYTWSGSAATTSIATGLSAGIHTITVSDFGNCRTATTTINITRPSTLTVNNATICSGQTATLTLGTSSSYTWSPGATLNATNTASVLANPTITTIYTVNSTNSQLCMSTNTAQVLVNPTPTTAAANTTICIGNSASLAVNAMPSYTWSPIAGLSASNTQSVIASPTITTVYTASFTNSFGCVGGKTIQVLVSSTQTAAIPNVTTCAGQTLNLSANGLTGIDYNWTGPLSFTSFTDNPSISPATTAMSGPYNFSVTSAAGCTTQAVTNVTVFAQPSLTITGNFQLCPATNLTLSGSGANTYTWAGPPPNNFSSTAQNTLVSNVSASDDGIYTLTGAFANGCSSSVSQSVSVTSVPVITFSYSNPVCVNGTLTLSSPAAASYTWSGPNAFTSSVQNPSITNVQTIASGVYTLVSTLNSCTASATQSITVNTLPVPTVTNNSSLCESNTLQLGATAGVTYTWTGPAGFNSTQPSPSVANVLLTNAGVYSVTVTDANGCEASAITSATILPNPTISVTGATVCLNQPGMLSVSGGTGCAWTGPGGFSSSIASPTINTVDNLTAGLYPVVVTAANTCTSGAIATLAFLPLPAVAATGTTVCLNSTATLSAAGAASYTWAGPNTYSATGPSVTFTAATALSSGGYTITGAGANGCINTVTTELATLPLPVPTATNNSAVCESHTLQLGAAGGVTYTWTGPGGFGSTQATPSITNALLSNAGVYSVTVTDNNGCRALATTAATILPNPTISVTGATVCLNQPGILSVSGSTNCTWTGPGGFSSSLTNPTITPVDNLTAGSYSVVLTAANTCTSGAITTLTFLPLPAVAATGATVCLNSAATLSASGANNYTWTGPGSYSATGSNITFTTTNALSAGVYTIAGADANGCVNTGTTDLATMLLPGVTTTNNVVCRNQPAQLACTGSSDVVGYLWNGPAAYTASAQTATIVSATNVSPVNYTVTVTALNGCTTQAVATLSTHTLPTVVATSTTICKNQPFTSIASGALTYTWNGPAGSNTLATYVFANVNGSSVGIYTIIGTDVNTCTNLTTASIDTLSLPVVTAGGSTVCIGKPATLIAGGAISYLWSGPGGYTSGSANAILPSTSNTTAQTYTVVGTAANTCTRAAYATLATYPLPQPTFTAPLRVCIHSTMRLQGAGAQTYTWSGPFNYFLANQDVSIPVFNMQQAGTYTLSVIDNMGCTNFTTTSILVDPAPTGKLVSNNRNNYCVPFCSEFWLKSSSASPIVSTVWKANNQTIASDTFNLCIAKAGDNGVVGTFTDAIGCTSTMSFAVQGNPTPVADFDFIPARPVESTDLVLFHDQSSCEKPVNWEWFFIDNKGFSSNSQNPSYIFEQAGTYAIAMQVTNSWGCADTVIKTIIVSSDFNLFVPDAFTPNDDGLNDIFMPKGNGISKYNLSIYDRWGNRIFETSDPATGWSGPVNGDNSADNVYQWLIECTDTHGKTKTLTGHVTCAR